MSVVSDGPQVRGQQPESRQPGGRDRGAWFVVWFVVLLLFIPSTVVLAGPLRSNGSPAVAMSVLAAVLVVLNLAVGRGEHRAASTGSLILVTSGALTLATWAAGRITEADADVRASQLRGLVELIGYTGIGLLTIKVVRTPGQRRAVVRASVAGLLFSGLVGLLQSGSPIDARFLFRPPGFVLNRDFAPAVRDGFVRVVGTSDSPIEFGVAMGVLIALGVFLVQVPRSRLDRALGILAMGVGAVGIPASVSRTGVLVLLVVFLAYSLSATLRAMGLALFAFGALIVAFFIASPRRFDALTELFSNASNDDSVTGRTDDYASSFTNFGEHPWFGIGLGSNPPTATRFLDNQWLQALVQGGSAGLVALALIVLGAFAACTAAIRRAPDREARVEGVAYLAATSAIVVSTFTFDLFGFNQAKFLLLVVFGLAWSAVRSADEAPRLEHVRVGPRRDSRTLVHGSPR